jgi:phenylacetate-coenzyme A ligase PaaK-like adenylate-forming protein
MAEYEELRQRHLLRAFEVIPELLARLTMPRDELRLHRESALRRIVAHAREHSPWHRDRLAAVEPEKLTEAGLGALPTMTKDDLMSHFDAIVTDTRLTRDVVETHLAGLTTDAYLLDEYHVCASGGSSGRRGAFVFDFEGWIVVFASYLRFSLYMSQQLLAAAPPSVMVMVAADKASHMTSAIGQTFAIPGSSMHRVPATSPLDRIVERLNDLQPDYLSGYASMIHQLTREAAAGRLRVAPRLVGTTSEPLLPEIRQAIAETWGTPIFNGFGSTEGLMGGSCSAGRGLHLSDDLFVIEPVGARGEPVAPGERAAKIYLTCLYNRVQPLIRYELTDEVTVIDEPCACGITLLRIDDIQGRFDDTFTYAGGITVHPFAFRSVLGRERNVAEYQVRQTPRGAEIRVRCDGTIDGAGIAAALRGKLSEIGLRDPEITITPVEILDRQESGKFRRFVPLREEKPIQSGAERRTPRGSIVECGARRRFGSCEG